MSDPFTPKDLSARAQADGLGFSDSKDVPALPPGMVTPDLLIPAMDAQLRGVQLLLVPMNTLPPVALSYLRHLSRRVGMCIETCLTAYAAYAHVVEKLPLGEDTLYHPPQDEITIIEHLAADHAATKPSA